MFRFLAKVCETYNNITKEIQSVRITSEGERMKVLIVDDNVAIREIIAEILMVDGYEIKQVGTVEGAYDEMEQFKPDIIVLDIVVEGKNMVNFIDSLEEDCETKIILLVNGKEQVPKDTPLIIGSVKKPFKSTDILELVRNQKAKEVESKVSKPVKESWTSKFKLFGKSNASKAEESDDNGPVMGKSYIVFEDIPSGVYSLATSFKRKECEMLVFTTDRTKGVTDRIGKNITVYGLTQRSKTGCIEYGRLGTVMSLINDHISKSVNPVVVFDDLTKVIEANGINPVLTMIYQIVSGMNRKGSMIISVKESLLTEKDKLLLFRYMEQYEPDDIV